MRKLVLIALVCLTSCKTIEKQGAGLVMGADGAQTDDLLIVQIDSGDEGVTGFDKQTRETFKGKLVHAQAKKCPELTDVVITSLIGAAMKDDGFIEQNSQCEVVDTGKSELVMKGNMGNSIQCIFQAQEQSHFPENGAGTCVYTDGRQINLEARNFKDVEVEVN
jgi:hypothetical protein